MRTTSQRWGNSLAIRIPKVLAEGAGLEEGREVEITLSEGRLIVIPLQTEPDYELDALLEGVTEDNLHTEVDFGRPQGDEVL